MLNVAKLSQQSDVEILKLPDESEGYFDDGEWLNNATLNNKNLPQNNILDRLFFVVDNVKSFIL